jgi:RNA polymerase sigma-70 factor (ECF subfamily)
VEAGEQGRTLRAAVNQLSPQQRKVIELAYFGGLTQIEIAEKLGEPLGTVKARARRGLLKLKELIVPQL